MPGPIIFGAIIDGTCKLWKYSCGERLSCQLYDIIKFRVAIISFGMVARGAAFLMILGLYIYFRVTKRENWREDSKPTAKEILINAEKTKENGVNMMSCNILNFSQYITKYTPTRFDWGCGVTSL